MQTRDGSTLLLLQPEPSIATPPTVPRHLLRAAKLQVVSGVRQADIMAAFNISRPTLARAVKRYREHGEDAFFERLTARTYRRRRPDGRQGGRTLASGMSGSACARHLGMPTTFNENRRAGVIAVPAPALAAVADAPQVEVTPPAQTPNRRPQLIAPPAMPATSTAHGPRGS